MEAGLIMNEQFQHLYRQLVEEVIDTGQFLRELRSLRDYQDDLLAALREQHQRQDWKNVGRLVWAVGLVPDRKFTSLLCDLLNNHPYDGYMEAVADALLEIADENSVACITRSLEYRVHGDDGRHFNRALINALFKIGTTEAIEGIKQASECLDEPIKTHAGEFLQRWFNSRT
jgi:hypothetical protein